MSTPISISTDIDTIDALVARLSEAMTTEALVSVVQDLGATKDPAVLPHLIKAFGFNRPAVAEIALAEVIRFGAAAVLPLLSTIDGYDYGARAYSVRALARIGDLRALNFLLNAIKTDFAPSVRRAATRGLGRVVAEAEISEQMQALAVLQECLSDSDWAIRYAAVCALADLHLQAPRSTTTESKIQPLIQAAIQTALQDPDRLIRVKAQVSYSTQF